MDEPVCDDPGLVPVRQSTLHSESPIAGGYQGGRMQWSSSVYSEISTSSGGLLSEHVVRNPVYSGLELSFYFYF